MYSFKIWTMYRVKIKKYILHEVCSSDQYCSNSCDEHYFSPLSPKYKSVLSWALWGQWPPCLEIQENYHFSNTPDFFLCFVYHWWWIGDDEKRDREILKARWFADEKATLHRVCRIVPSWRRTIMHRCLDFLKNQDNPKGTQKIWYDHISVFIT